MSPFDGKSCFDFYIRVARNRQQRLELGQELHRHAEICSCPCPLCVRLRKLADRDEA